MHQKICHSVEKTEDDFRISMKKQSNNKTMQLFVLQHFFVFSTVKEITAYVQDKSNIS